VTGPDIPDYIPDTFSAGQTVKFTRVFQDYPPATSLVFTAVAAGGGQAVYSFSSYTGPAPQVGQAMNSSGFSNGGNNVSGVAIAAISGGPGGGTVTVAATTQVNETHAGAGVTDGYSYTIYFNGSRAVFSKTAIFDAANNFLVTLTPSDLNVAADDYQYEGRVSNAVTGEVYAPDRGWVHLQFDLSTAGPGANLSQAQKLLQDLDDLIAARIAGDVPKRYMIGGRDLQKEDLKTLLTYRGIIAARVSRETNPGTLGTTPLEVAFDLEGNDADFPPTWVDVTGLQSP
jgi:hypothetical protein